MSSAVWANILSETGFLHRGPRSALHELVTMCGEGNNLYDVLRVVHSIQAVSRSMTVSAKRSVSGPRIYRLALQGVLLLGIAGPPTAYAVGPVSTSVAPPGAVVITPGMAIQTVVNAHPSATTYFLAAGLYRTQQILPKDGDRFIGAFGARLNGARVLTGARPSGGVYVFDDQAPEPHAMRHGRCQAGFPRCDRPQALFVEDRPMRAVGRLADVGPGTWYFDYDARRIYIPEDPAGRTVELTDRPFAFGGNARDVRIENLIVEKYASADQQGAINDSGSGTGWTIVNNEVRLNYGYGITLASGHRAIANYVHGNGELGIGGGNSSGILVENNEIAYNAWNGTACDWECGGAKWGAVSNLIVRGNYVHGNGGDGLWTDERCRNVLYEGNRIEDNALAGISHEISYSAVIRNNTFRGNGRDTFVWGWHAQIQVQNSSNTEVYGNRIELDAVRGGNGITIIQQNRGSYFVVHDVFVHDNDVIMRGGQGVVAGWFADYDADRFTKSNNRFERDRYFVHSLASDNGRWFANAPVSFQAWQSTGADRAGSATTELP